MDAAASSDYGWAETGGHALEAISLTFIQPEDAECLAALRPRTRLPDDLTIAEALAATLKIDDFAWGSLIAQSDALDHWSVIVEPNGWAGSVPEVLAHLSRRGRALNVFWNVNALMGFSWAIAGEVIRQFDPLLYDGTEALPEEAGLPFGLPGRCRVASLALLARLTGLRLDRAWLLERRRPAFVVPVPAQPDGPVLPTE